MLDEIQKRFADINDLWNKLDKINFYFRDIEEMKLTDDIYIKMNSRGKPLTDFEHFRASRYVLYAFFFSCQTKFLTFALI